MLIFRSSRHDSPNYGKHYTLEQLTDLFAPAQESVDAIRSWLESSGIESHRISQSTNKQWIQVDMPAADLEGLLKTEYHVFENDAGTQHISCDQ